MPIKTLLHFYQMDKGKYIGIDMGGTQIRCGRLQNLHIEELRSETIHAEGSINEIVQQLIRLTESVFSGNCLGIGIGVPGLVDFDKGIVYDLINLPSWKKLDLRSIMTRHFKVPVHINNDANCFALAEYYFGKGKGVSSLAGVTIGTGLGTGLVIGGKLYTGKNGGAGEFGMMPYLQHSYEYYGSGQFFRNQYGITGTSAFEKALAGEQVYAGMFAELGRHLGNALKAILYAVDPEIIILGGSVSRAYPLFQSEMWKSLRTFGFEKTLESLRIEVSELDMCGVLGAAALSFEQQA